MKLLFSSIAAGALFVAPSTASADTSSDMAVGFENSSSAGSSGKELPPYLQCVPYARELSGIQIYGDARSWWDHAAGRYQRGSEPQVGAVMAFQPHRNMTLGHVAAVSKIIDQRTVLLSHSNWSPINGRRGQIERNVRAVDVSPNNDWSKVRVWYHPLQALGKTAWPVRGFIYGKKATSGAKSALAKPRLAELTSPLAVTPKPSKKFSQAFASLGAPARTQPQASPRKASPVQTVPRPLPRRVNRVPDPVRAAIARYEQ